LLLHAVAAAANDELRHLYIENLDKAEDGLAQGAAVVELLRQHPARDAVGKSGMLDQGIGSRVAPADQAD